MTQKVSYRFLLAAVFFAIVAVFFVFSALMMHSFGISAESAMDDAIIMDAQQGTGANNAVTSVVFDFRGFDTLGEATILFTAVAGVLVLFRRLKK
jgi:multisubunit Na+/H+ antiporter MnhB subunit